MSNPAEPSGLGKAGRRLWRSHVTALDFADWELPVLELACRTADELARIEEGLAASTVMVAGSMNQSRANPLLTEVREHRAALGRLLTQLAPSQAQPKPLSVSDGARVIAMQRWRKEKTS